MAENFNQISDFDLIDLIQKREAEFLLLEEEAIRRATEGTIHKIVLKEIVVGEMQLYSDVLLDFMLNRVMKYNG